MATDADQQRTWPHQGLRAVLFALGLALAGNAVWLVVNANLTLGTALVGVAAALFLAWAFRLGRHRPGVLDAVAGLVCFAVLAASGFLFLQGRSDNADYTESAAIVLGAGLRGRVPSEGLTRRLEVAVRYHERNPDAIIVVSGGQGMQEEVPEAIAMRDYLVGRGVPAAAILTEDRSTSTEENFAFSKRLLDDQLPAGYTTVFITDDFHVYRATALAQEAGYTARHLASLTPWYSWPANYLRETTVSLSRLLPR